MSVGPLELESDGVAEMARWVCCDAIASWSIPVVFNVVRASPLVKPQRKLRGSARSYTRTATEQWIAVYCWYDRSSITHGYVPLHCKSFLDLV